MAGLTATACSDTPELAANQAQSYNEMVGTSGQDYLLRISSHEWDDGGKAAAESLAWISRDAHSDEPEMAEQAGQAAHAIAEFLAGHRQALSRLPVGWFGMQKKPLGQLNPYLLESFSSALEPFQGAIVGDGRGVSGFTLMGGPDQGDLSRVRAIFAVFASDTQVGERFNESAEERAKAYLEEYAKARSSNRQDASDTLATAGTLAGVADGGAAESGNEDIETRSARYWENWANYELATAIGANRGVGGISKDFFDANGALKSPDDVTPEQLVLLSNELQNFVTRAGFGDTGQEIREWYDIGVGK